ncbi:MULTISPECIES: flagellar hook-basal body complex protein FliE [Cryobacterium]|jgi:flagellar hook-basal body complex protein FliE|uniref:Flagellar hook-basal body complex protein FliE n=3 Tax=Cryobacterium TaxID=69578 RepID=A0ABY7NC58_9MICO|nr:MULTISPECIES: flagellar hook-basal body complex protein FliE [Cryobacterium]MDY7527476.1 flagellar hook-basal body complex protein FliE [Cryobacterium sp. 10C2]MDY7556737.1 flagellar hook-basal body complex protein FliE [Cryobacterium sp. 10C3]MEB0002327.1 flagellar hook-basal body complex protein FliE [Cryobacterium sp. RTC2.1]MEB0201427.1 flagellar hook-basal body complex protein FliE [Cryobacterium sp. 5I3]MEB0286378.1 flagellar hook-basal body complex protein FliE [Cryobacterium sp. 10S
MTIASIGALALQASQATQSVQATQSSQATTATDGSGFGTAMAGAVDNLQQLQSTANTQAVAAVTGNLNDIASATIAATRAQVSLELVAAVRNKGVDAFNEIMRMQA